MPKPPPEPESSPVPIPPGSASARLSPAPVTATTPSPHRKIVTTYKFGVLKVLSGEALALAELAQQTLLWNQLCDEERKFRAQFNAWLISLEPQLQVQEDRIAELKRQLARIPSRQEGSEGHTQAEALFAEMKVAIENNASIRKQLLATRKAELKAFQKENHDALLSVCRRSSLWWSHREAVLSEFDVARIAAIKRGRDVSPRVFDGSGTLSARLTSGSARLTFADLMKGRTERAQFKSLDQEALDELPNVKAIKLDGSQRLVFNAIVCDASSTGGRKLRAVVTMHREVPPDAIVKLLTITRRSVAGSLKLGEWSVSVVCEVAAPACTPIKVQPVVVRLFAIQPSNAEFSDLPVAIVDECGIGAHLSAAWLRTIAAARLTRIQRRSDVADFLRLLTSTFTSSPVASTHPLAQRILTCLPAHPSLRELQAFFDDFGSACECFGEEPAAVLRASINSIVRKSEVAYRLSLRATRHRDHVYKTFVARVCALNRPVVVVHPVLPDGQALAQSDMLSRVAPDHLVQLLSQSCARVGLPFSAVG